MNLEKELPEIGTPEQALEKMKNSYQAFIDSLAKFITIAEYYTEKTNEGQPLPSDFQTRYTSHYQNLKKETAENIGYQIAFFALVYLDFVEEIKENVQAYQDMLANGPDKEASAYDQACDYLAIKDEFSDIITTLNDISMTIASERIAETNLNNPEYDYNAKQVEESRFN
jgi:hypothetical protein